MDSLFPGFGAVKKCKTCGEEKPTSDFYIHSKKKPIPRTVCKDCQHGAVKGWRDGNLSRANSRLRDRYANDPVYRERKKAAIKRWRESHPEETRAQQAAWLARQDPDRNRRYMLKRYYGIDLEHYDRLLVAQGGACAICRQPEMAMDGRTGKPWPLAVDHDHASGAVRGLLCRRCNNAIGSFEDRPELLDSAATYLREHRLPPAPDSLVTPAQGPGDCGGR